MPSCTFVSFVFFSVFETLIQSSKSNGEAHSQQTILASNGAHGGDLTDKDGRSFFLFVGVQNRGVTRGDDEKRLLLLGGVGGRGLISLMRFIRLWQTR